MLTLTFQCQTIAELQKEMSVALATMTASQVTVTHTSRVLDPQTEFDLTLPSNVIATAPPPEEKKRSRRTKAEIEASKLTGLNDMQGAGGMTNMLLTPVPADEFPDEKIKVSAAPLKSDKPTREAVHVALQQVNSACGLPKAREILKEFEAQRISDLKEEKYQGFIEKCDAAVMQA